MNEKKLAQLFTSMFSAEELRHLLRSSFGRELTDGLPGADAPPAVLAARAVEALVERGLVSRALFDALRAERPRRAAEIDAAEAAWKNEPEGPRAFEWLSDSEFRAVHRAAVDGGLARVDALGALLEGISPGYVQTIDAGGSAAARLLTMLRKMNGVRNLRDGTIPLARWLENAAMLTAGQVAEREFSRALERVQSAGQPDPLPPPVVSSDADLAQLELQLSRTDQNVSASFLVRGAAAARSVARVLVHRHFGGVPSFTSDGVADYSLGTGWLVARDLLITNHHVIAARDAGEPPATPEDLERQAAVTEVQFDFVVAGTTPQSTAVRQLVIADPGLDFALLRLSAVDRPPLRLAPRALQRDARAPLQTRVNLLHHPNGEPMRVGLRNNFVVQGDAKWLSYLTDTHGGSSGSPVCDDTWSVVALHRGYRDLVGATVRLDGMCIRTENYGVQILAILEWLRANLPAVHQEIVSGQGEL